ncbi:hypothetical protein ACIF6L_34575 [Kitasatospora sp. NPDC086009]|uniref:hypothetical protein n=1 Tax=unclassified Kitasatospora TaxID=2633591 RepID=UPI0037C79A6B
MTTALAVPDALTLPPLDLDPRPAEQTFADGLADDLEPETFLWIRIRQPDGGSHVHYRWTAGGRELGDHIDQAALAAELDSSDTLYIANRHLTEHEHGEVLIQAHPLRPIQADVVAGVRAPEGERAKLRRIIQLAAEHSGRYDIAANPRVPRWFGVGPKLLTGR